MRMVPFRLTCLGPPELHGPDGDPIRFRTRKHFALLIYLAVEPSVPHRRDRLATLLWGGADVEEARHSLATGLSLLRGRVGPDAFEATRDTVRLLPGRVVSDLTLLEHDDPADAGAATYGPFLEEFEVADAADFQQWKDAQHARLVPRLHEALARRIEHARRHGDSRRMEAIAQRLERVDDLSEEAARATVEARAMAGDRIGGLRVFDRWRARLADQLGATPSPLLDRMAERLRRNAWERPSPVLVAPVPTAHWKERIFVGRAAEFEACYRAWERVKANDPRHVLVRGDSGIGKTTLVDRFVTAAALEGASVARVQCYELERELPFGMIGGLVAHLLDLPGSSATPPAQLAELGRLVPKVGRRYPALPAPLPSTGESARILFTEAVMALVAALAEEQPVVLVVDDMHLADVTSLAVLHLMLRRMENLPFMVLLTSSSGLGAAVPGAQRFIDPAGPAALSVLRVGPLAESEAVELLDGQLAHGTDPGPTIRRAIVAGARGNPMVLELLIDDWRRRGDQCLALSLGAMTTSAEPPPREAFRRLVDGTLAALDPETRAVAELAAILGRRLNDLAMYTLVDLPVARTMRAMTTLAAQRVFRDAGNQLEFANEFVRGQCYVAMAAPLRRMLHGLVADRLLAQDGAAEPIPGLETAWHLVRAGRLPEAVPYLLAGGRESIRRGAPHEADLALSTGLPALTGEARRTAILLLAEAMQELGRWADSLRLLDNAREPFSASEECCRDVFRIIARRWLGYMNAAAMGDAAGQLYGIAVSDADVEVRVKALSAMSALLTQTRDSYHLSRLESAIGVVSRVGMDDYQRLHLLLATAWHSYQVRNTANAQRIIAEAVQLIDSTGAASSVAVRILIGSGALQSVRGDYQSAIEPLSRALRMATKLDNPLHIAAA
ncbi:MAG TPA: AAA family ATPase, partial [Gemmatimonadales bacterium]|nr:AAA family ATPase [Gemmatimonadales bacterium]